MTLRDVLNILWHRLWLLVLIPMLCALGVGLYTYRFLPNYYTSTATLYILVDQGLDVSSSSYSGLSYNMGVSQQIATDVSELITSRRARLLATEYLSSDEDPAYTVSAYVDEGSRILRLSVSSYDPGVVADVANALSKVAAELAHNIMNVDSINVIDSAVDPSGPSGPNRRVYIAGAAGGGLIITAALVLLAAKLDTRVRSARDAERASGLTCVGRIPEFKVSTSAADDGRRAADRNARSVADARDAVQSAVTNLLFLKSSKQARVIVVSSPADEEGRSTVTVLAAQTLAAYGNSVLLMEGDLNNRSLAELIDVHPERGLHAVVNGQAPFLEAVRRTKQSNLYFLDVEQDCTNATGLFSSKNFKSLLKLLRKKYDYVLIDTPPVDSFVYAAVLASEADATLVLAREGVTRKGELRRGADQLRHAGVTVAGVALNFASVSRAERRQERRRERKRRARQETTEIAALAMREDVVSVVPEPVGSDPADAPVDDE